MSETDASHPDMSLDQFGKSIYRVILDRLTTILNEVLSRDAGPPNNWEVASVSRPEDPLTKIM